LRKAGIVFTYGSPALLSRRHEALPSKPLNTIALHDADHESALRLVKARLHDAGVDIQFSREETEKIICLGGRASDLASVRLYPT